MKSCQVRVTPCKSKRGDPATDPAATFTTRHRYRETFLLGTRRFPPRRAIAGNLTLRDRKAGEPCGSIVPRDSEIGLKRVRLGCSNRYLNREEGKPFTVVVEPEADARRNIYLGDVSLPA
jgi:hypothetical protein